VEWVQLGTEKWEPLNKEEEAAAAAAAAVATTNGAGSQK